MKYIIYLILFLSVNIYAERWNDADNFKRLLHYKDGKSLVKDKDFFLNIDGNTDIKKELISLKKSYNLPITLKNNHPRCKFPDRYFWLSKQIKLKNYTQYPSFCTSLNKWKKDNPAKSISIFFVSGYFSNPASVFGHNLIKFNSKNDDLFDLVLNFGAKVPKNENSLTYIFKGLFGGYDARFSDQEFYKKDLVYSKKELRDMWDYELNLSSDELTLIYMHIWSIKDKLFDYYFLKENCAYQIAGILDILIDMDMPEYKQWYIPVELTNQIIKHKNKIKSVTYKPSSETLLFEKFANLNSIELGVIEKYIKNIEQDNKQINTKILDLLLEYYNYLLLDEYDEALAKKRDFILIKRLQLPIAIQDENIKNTPTPPHSYPAPSYLKFSANKNYIFSEFSIFNNALLGNHSLTNSELVAPSIKFRTKNNNIIFDSFNLFKITKLNKNLKNFPTQNISWEVKLGLNNITTIKPTIVAGVGKVVFSNESNLLYAMSSIFVNDDEYEFSPRIKIGLLHTNKLGKFSFLHQIDINNNKKYYEYKWQKQINKHNSIFFKKNQDNAEVGIGFYF